MNINDQIFELIPNGIDELVINVSVIQRNKNQFETIKISCISTHKWRFHTKKNINIKQQMTD